MSQNNINTESNLGKLLVSYDKACASLNNELNESFIKDLKIGGGGANLSTIN